MTLWQVIIKKPPLEQTTSESLNAEVKQLFAMNILLNYNLNTYLIVHVIYTLHTTNDKSLLTNTALAKSNHSNQQRNDIECWGTMILKCWNNNSNVSYELVLTLYT